MPCMKSKYVLSLSYGLLLFSALKYPPPDTTLKGMNFKRMLVREDDNCSNHLKLFADSKVLQDKKIATNAVSNSRRQKTVCPSIHRSGNNLPLQSYNHV